MPDNEEACEIITKMKLTLITGKKWGSSTDDPVKLYIGEHEWDLDNPFCDDFEKGKTDVFELDIPEGLTSDWFQYFCLRKERAIHGDKWLLSNIKVEINDRLIYDSGEKEIWFQDGDVSWCAADFVYGKCRGSISPEFDVKD
ncbi:MAG: PLAT/LH2 domain-containing protein [Candidatus Heimdallarchaeota archaeon]